MKIRNRSARLITAAAVSLPVSVICWVCFAFLLPGMVIGWAYGPSEDLPIGTGLLLGFVMIATSPFVVFLAVHIALRVSKALLPVSTEPNPTFQRTASPPLN